MTASPPIALIVAMDQRRLIGANNDLPWRLPADLRWFARQTMGKPVVMGRKTYDSIPPAYRPLSGRTNIVVTRSRQYAAPGAHLVHAPQEAITAVSQIAPDAPEIMIGGGSTLFAHFLPRATRIYLTLIHAAFAGDVYFPSVNWLEWEPVYHKDHPADDRHAVPFTWFIFERR